MHKHKNIETCICVTPTTLCLCHTPATLCVTPTTFCVTYQPHSVSHQPHSVSHQPHSVQHQPHSVTSATLCVTYQPHSMSHQPHSVSHQPHSVSHQPHSVTSATLCVTSATLYVTLSAMISFIYSCSPSSVPAADRKYQFLFFLFFFLSLLAKCWDQRWIKPLQRERERGDSFQIEFTHAKVNKMDGRRGCTLLAIFINIPMIINCIGNCVCEKRFS